MNQDHDQGRASNAGLDDLGCGAVLVSHEGEERQEVWQQEVVTEKNGNGEPPPEERGEKRSCLTTSEKDESDQYSEDGNPTCNTDNNGLKNNQDSRPTKRRKQTPDIL